MSGELIQFNPQRRSDSTTRFDAWASLRLDLMPPSVEAVHPLSPSSKARDHSTQWKCSHRKSHLPFKIRQRCNLTGIFRITFTYGGISIDERGHALTADKSIIPGLVVAGVDAGGFSNLGYAGGLALAFVTGLWAARVVARELELPEPSLPAADAKDAAPMKGRL